jgi:hypothetical protein
MNPAIVIVTYNRQESLKRLLNSVQNAKYGDNSISLIISIDGGGLYNDDILQIAENFYWKYGQKRIIAHKQNLGLRNHILSCGDLSLEYGAVIILEDDLYVSPYYYDFARSSIQFYGSDERIAQISLYSFNIHIHTLLPFIPLKLEYDTYFVQYPSSWGQCWTKKQWADFRNWYNQGQKINLIDKIPNHIKKWPESSWLKYFIKYLVSKNKFTVFPYLSYSTNFNDAGVHNRSDQRIFQSSLAINANNILFSPLTKNSLIYDVYFELHKEFIKQYSTILSDFKFDFEVDLYGIKYQDGIIADYYLSTRSCKNPLLVFPLQLRPIELNLFHLAFSKGPSIVMAKRENFKKSIPKLTLWEYFTLQMSFPLTLKHILLRFLKKLNL